MARIRTIKPVFFKHERLYELERETGLPMRVAFAGLWTQADREGRFEWRPRRLKTDILPYDEIDFALILNALADAEMVQRYEVDGKEYGFIPSWHEHQQVNKREQASRLPDPGQCAHPSKQVHAHDESSGEREGEREKDSEPIGSADAEALKARVMGPLAAWIAKNDSVAESSSKSFLGMCCRDYGTGETLHAGIEAHREGAPNARAYMRAVLDKGGGVNGKDFSMSAVWKELDDEYRSEIPGEPDHLEADDDAVREAPPH